MSSNIRTTSTFHNPKYVECIEACNHCANVCEYCGFLCLREENVKMMIKCIELCFYPADVYRFASKYISCDSSYAKQICETCAKVCERHNIDHCKQCSQVYYECAKVCRSM